MTTPRLDRPRGRAASAALALLALAAGAALLARPRAGDSPDAQAPTPEGPTVRAASLRSQQDGPSARTDLLDGGVAWLNSAQPIRSQDLIGKVVLLDFWTYCCINCHHVLPDLEKLERKYAEELVVIGVHSPKFEAERDTENIRKKVREYQIKHPVVNDAEMAIWRRFNVRSWPTLAIIDANGNFRGSLPGEGNYDRLDEFIGKLVADHRAKGELDETPFVVYAESDRPSDGPLLFPGKVLADPEGGRLFISDTGHHRIVVTDLDGAGQFVIGGGRRGFEDGGFDAARFHRPQGLCLVGDALYVADTENHAIRRVDLSGRAVETVAGTGEQLRRITDLGDGEAPARQSLLNSPWDLIPQPGANALIIAMAGPHQLWRLDLDRGTIGVWAGTGREDVIDGTRATAALAQPSGLATDGRFVYVADSEGSSVRAVSLGEDGRVRTLVGQHDLSRGQSLFSFGDVDGIGEEVRLQHCLGLAFGDGTLYIADSYNNKVKACDPATRAVRTLVGTGEAGSSDSAPSFYQPGGLALAGRTLYVADSNNHLVRAVDLGSAEVRTLPLDGVAPPEPPKRKPTFANAEAIAAPRAEVAPGDRVAIELDLAIPGFKLQPDSPVLYLVEAPEAPDALGAAVSPTGDREVPDGETLTIPVPLSRSFEAGDALTLAVSASIFACSDSGGFCTLKQYSWTLPLSFAEGAGESVRLAPPSPEPASNGE